MKIIFDHRQKTAGTSFRAFLADALGNERVSPILLEGSIVLATHLLDRFDVVCGHFDLPPDYDFPSDIYHVTLLRDPIDRFLSHVSYLRDVDDADPVSAYLRQTDLAQIIDDGERRLGPWFWNAYSYHFARDEADVAAAALRVLDERFQLVGITEEFPQTIACLCADLGLPVSPAIPYERPTARRIRQAELEPAKISTLRRLMALDFDLYRAALAMFRRRISGAPMSPGTAAAEPPPANPQVAAAEPPPANSEVTKTAPAVVTLKRAEVCGTLSVSSRPGRGAEIDIGCEVETAVELRTLDFRVRIYNDWQILVYEDGFRGVEDGLNAGETCELGITAPLTIGLGHHVVDLQFYAEQTDGWVEVVEVRRACDFVVERSPEVTSAGLVALAATPYHRRGAADEMAGYAAQLSLLEQPQRLVRGATATARLEVRNKGAHPLEIFGVHRVTLGYHIRDARTGEILPQEMLRTSLGTDLVSGGRTLLEATLVAPEVPGTYVVEWDLVREWVAWFGLDCTAPLEVFAEGD